MKNGNIRVEYNQDTGVYTLTIFGSIYYWDMEDAKYQFAEALSKGATQVDILVHSPGGDAFVGAAINSLIGYYKKSLPATAYILGLCASAATYAIIPCNKVYIGSNAMYMIHNCSASTSGTKGEIEKTLEQMDKINDSMADAYALKTGKTVGEIKAMMNAETYMSAKEAVDNGFVDGIMDYSGVQVESQSDLRIAAEAKDAQTLFSQYNVMTKINYQANPVFTEDENKWIEANKNAIRTWIQNPNEADKVMKIQALITRAEAAEQKVVELEEKVLEAAQNRIDDLLYSAIEQGKVTAADKVKYKGLSYEQVNAFLKDLKPAVKPSHIINRAFASESRRDWNFDRWAKEDPNGLAKMEAEDPEKFNSLYNQYLSK